MPASGDVLLDTSVVIPFFKGDKAVGAQLASATIYLPQIALGELYCGANLSANRAKNRNEIQNFLAAVTVLSSGVAQPNITEKSARHSPGRERRFLKMTSGSRRWLSNMDCHWPPATRTLTKSPG